MAANSECAAVLRDAILRIAPQDEGRRLRREQLLALCPVERFVERAAELVEQLVDLGRLDDQRRADRNDVARDEAHDQALGLRVRDDSRTEAALRIEWPLARFVRREFNRTD